MLVIFLMLMFVYRSVVRWGACCPRCSSNCPRPGEWSRFWALTTSSGFRPSPSTCSSRWGLRRAPTSPFSSRPLSRGPSARRKSRNRLLHDVSRRRSRHAGSGLTIAGATFCLRFSGMPYFQTLGIPLAVGMVVAVVVALTLAPAVMVAGRPSACSTRDGGCGPGLAAGRHRGRALAACQFSSRRAVSADRTACPAGIQTEL